MNEATSIKSEAAISNVRNRRFYFAYSIKLKKSIVAGSYISIGFQSQ